MDDSPVSLWVRIRGERDSHSPGTLCGVTWSSLSVLCSFRWSFDLLFFLTRDYMTASARVSAPWAFYFLQNSPLMLPERRSRLPEEQVEFSLICPSSHIHLGG